MKIEVISKEVFKDLEQLKKDNRKAVRLSTRKAATQALNAGKKEVRVIYNVKLSTINESIKMKQKDDNEVIIQIKSRKLGLSHFNPTQTKKGVKVTILRRKRRLIKGAFISKKLYNNVFIRERNYKHKKVGKKWHGLPIKVLTAYSIPQLFSTKRTREVMHDYYKTNYTRIYESTLKYVRTK